MLSNSQAAQKGPDARRRPAIRVTLRLLGVARRGLSGSAREAYSDSALASWLRLSARNATYVERATEAAIFWSLGGDATDRAVGLFAQALIAADGPFSAA